MLSSYLTSTPSVTTPTLQAKNGEGLKSVSFGSPNDPERTLSGAHDARPHTLAGIAGGVMGRVETWRGGLGAACLFPALSSAGTSIASPCFRLQSPAHRTGRADFPHPALARTSGVTSSFVIWTQGYLGRCRWTATKPLTTSVPGRTLVPYAAVGGRREPAKGGCRK